MFNSSRLVRTLVNLSLLNRTEDGLCADLERLGLGQLRLVEQEKYQASGGQLDTLAACGDTTYSIEVQLGEVDASHGFRVFGC